MWYAILFVFTNVSSCKEHVHEGLGIPLILAQVDLSLFSLNPSADTERNMSFDEDPYLILKLQSS